MSSLPSFNLVLFGATGDLAQRKVFPALLSLFQKGALPEDFEIIAFSRRPWKDPDFYQFLGEKYKELFPYISYFEGHFEDRKSFERLGKLLQEKKQREEVLFYLAIPPQYYEVLLQHLKLTLSLLPWAPSKIKVLVEKPLGRDLVSAKKIERELHKVFSESQIYRIDHYLAKEALQDILVFRFSNNLFEKLWDQRFIEKIEIRLWEKKGVEGRESFYDSLGALRDVGQNHLLQMLALVAMERPSRFSATEIRKKREEVLSKLRPLTNWEIKNLTFRAQYRGYRDLPGVREGSNTETYFKTVAFLEDPRWHRVPIILESGKKIKEQRKEIVIYLRHPTPCLCPNQEHLANRIIFSLEPQEGVHLEFWRKKPGLSFEIWQQTCFCPLVPEKETSKREQYVREYERLLIDVLRGDKTLFVTKKEVLAMWSYIDPILKVWEKGEVPLNFYAPDTLEAPEQSSFIDLFQVPKEKKEVGIVGLGKMGSNLARNLLNKGWQVIGYNRSREKTLKLAKEGLRPAFSLSELVEKLSPPRIIILSLPAGYVIDEVLFKKGGLAEILEKGDIILDFGNSFYQNSVKRAKTLKKKGIHFLDVGISGGPEGARKGPALMIGGEKKIFQKIEGLFWALSGPEGYLWVGESGAGHFAKMVHNAIEYGMMQSIAEGFDLLRNSPYKISLSKVARLYNNGAVVQSKLLEHLEKAFERWGENLRGVSEFVPETGETGWALRVAKKLGVRMGVIKKAFLFRKRPKREGGYQGKVLRALRGIFGGHEVRD